MNTFDQIEDFLVEKMDELELLKEKVERSLKKAPGGKLVLSSSKGKTQYFHKNS